MTSSELTKYITRDGKVLLDINRLAEVICKGKIKKIELPDGKEIDIAQIVRCKNCKHWDAKKNECHNINSYMQYKPCFKDWFCADGERKGETEIVRCKDCKHFCVEDQSCKYHGMYIPLKPDNYCAHGERR